MAAHIQITLLDRLPILFLSKRYCQIQIARGNTQKLFPTKKNVLSTLVHRGSSQQLPVFQLIAVGFSAPLCELLHISQVQLPLSQPKSPFLPRILKFVQVASWITVIQQKWFSVLVFWLLLWRHIQALWYAISFIHRAIFAFLRLTIGLVVGA